MKIKFWTYPLNCGDGSVSVCLFKTKEEAKKLQTREEEYEGWAEDCVQSFTLEVDSEGNILSGADSIDKDGDVV